ncbi:uncharacterized protein CANTADRAFT_22424 [Suhomyces tanzawaensis NRRL Y-17324]|uniref:Uncharacterized protein n=1 Tax=Suhomyces tanzawaensis NRRL Y-17324 TaxID=984487 RepID=A0A1E4SFX8_9ASCO|nr:uncharacterized protein CANTADRAFT_22424 [Suhomyces tanzawaensis NRRL Y-17324]ODV78418.1 hypothetical protein CANTADRAFT_22424 [Suhomyces tanzawaensis NRRL Y-17324]
MAEYGRQTDGGSHDHEENRVNGVEKNQLTQSGYQEIRRWLIWLGITVITILVVQRYGLLRITKYHSGGSPRLQEHSPRTFHEIELDPIERFDIDNIKYVWIVMGAVLVAVSAIVATG